MNITIVDCYTDEPAGLGVPPYLGTYPRYIAGYFSEDDVKYLTIDDLRLWNKSKGKIAKVKPSQKSDIFSYNLTNNYQDVENILRNSNKIIFVLGVHVPGKYLSAVPGTFKEIEEFSKNIRGEVIVTGPGLIGSQAMGGKKAQKASKDLIVDHSLYNFSYEDIVGYSIQGAKILSQIPDIRMIEIETGHGCDIGKCSFCTEPLKNRLEFRKEEDVIAEVKEFYRLGARYFRIGKQNCFYSVPYAAELLKEIRESCPQIKVLHIDNVNPVKVVADKDDKTTKAIVKYCTSGNVAAFGVESFDPVVVRENCLNCGPKSAYDAVKKLNELGSARGEDGMPRFLPGINIIFGLKGETKETHTENMKWLSRIYDEGLMLRRINIRQVAIFEGTKLYEERSATFKKNKKYYWKWRDEIRQKIDFPMLKRVIPSGTVLKDCYAEIYDGKTTFCRQFGTYPIIIGVKGRLELKKFYDLRITGHMLRSVVGEINTQ